MPRISLDNQGTTSQGANTSNSAVDPAPQETSPSNSNLPSKLEPQLEQEIQTPVDVELKEKSGGKHLSAFTAYPTGIFFAGEEEGEQIILLLRAHIVTNVPWILVTIVLILIPIIFFPVLVLSGFLPAITVGTGLVIVALWYAGVFTYAFLNFLYWYFNVYMVTNERTVDIDWYSVVVHRFLTVPVSKIQDVDFVQVGVFAGLFNYGNVKVLTAGTDQNFEFTSVPYPSLVAKKIEEMMTTEEGEFETS